MYNYPKRVSECEREKEKYTKNIERDQDRNRRINQEGKTGRRKGWEERRGSNMLKILKIFM